MHETMSWAWEHTFCENQLCNSGSPSVGAAEKTFFVLQVKLPNYFSNHVLRDFLVIQGKYLSSILVKSKHLAQFSLFLKYAISILRRRNRKERKKKNVLQTKLVLGNLNDELYKMLCLHFLFLIIKLPTYEFMLTLFFRLYYRLE